MKVRTNMFKKELFIGLRKGSRCEICSINFENQDNDIAMRATQGQKNQIICHKCALAFIENGEEDISAKISFENDKRKQLIQMIEDTGVYRKSYYEKSLEDLSQDELQKKYIYCKELKEKKDKIDSISISPEEAEIEHYLIKDYRVIQDVNYLKCEEQIKDYFEDDYHEYFDCGQGYFQDEADVIVKIAKKYYKVKLYADICSAKQDIGDRLYWVENLEKVKYKEIEKPLQKDRKDVKFKVVGVSKEEQLELISFLEKFKYEVKIV